MNEYPFSFEPTQPDPEKPFPTPEASPAAESEIDRQEPMQEMQEPMQPEPMQTPMQAAAEEEPMQTAMPQEPVLSQEPAMPQEPVFSQEPTMPQEPVFGNDAPQFAYIPQQPTYIPQQPAYIPPQSAYIPPQPMNYPPQAANTKPPKAKRERKKSNNPRIGRRIAILALCCALLGGAVGGAAVGLYFADRNEASVNATSSGQTVIQQTNTPTVTPVVNEGDPISMTQLYQQSVPSIVGITNETTSYYYGQPYSSTSSGTGFIITDDGEILTNYHVIEDADTLTVTLSDGSEYEAAVLGYEEESDVALIKINASGLTPVTLGDSDALNVGEQVAAIGNPLGELTYTMTVGYLSAKGRAVYTEDMPINMMQIDAAINPGNSGGPLFNSYGQVVGITTAKYTTSVNGTTVEGIGFAIPINDVLSILGDLRDYGAVQNRAYIGVTVTNSTSPSGACVYSVENGSAGQKAGLQVGDVITAVENYAVTGTDGLYQALRPYRAGDSAKLTVYRDGESITLTITFGTKNDDTAVTEPTEETTEETTNPFSGFPWDFFS